MRKYYNHISLLKPFFTEREKKSVYMEYEKLLTLFTKPLYSIINVIYPNFIIKKSNNNIKVFLLTTLILAVVQHYQILLLFQKNI